MEKEKFLLQISYSWGDEEPDIECKTKEEAWKKAKELAMKETAVVNTENQSEVGLFFDEENLKITLHYMYDDSYCYYKVVKKPDTIKNANVKRFERLYREIDFLLNSSPVEDDCTVEDNKIYSDMANLKNSLFDAGYGN